LEGGFEEVAEGLHVEIDWAVEPFFEPVSVWWTPQRVAGMVCF
jgi:hypothetical protein